ncbi:MAG: WD40/YVTN/BNR-like repeat-containing protein [Saprospiraceae bacterium]
MTNQSKKYPLLILLILVVLCSCQQKNTNSKQFDVPINESVKNFNITAEKSQPVEKPAVIYRSTDMGKTWTSFAKGIPENATLSGIIQEGNKLYVTTDYHGIFKSIDGENNWNPLSSDKLKGLDINCIEVEGNQLVIGTLNRGILVSNDGGITWNPSKTNIANSVRAFIKIEGKLYAGTDSGIFESTDMGNTWSHLFGKIQILGFTFLNNKIYAATQNGVLVSNENASVWRSIYDGDALHDIGNDGQYIYAMTIGQQLLKTQNDGELWKNAQNGITYPVNFYTNELKHTGSNIFSAQWIGIYHSSNNGNSWNKLNGLPDSTAFSTLEITDYGIVAGISIR